MEDEVAALVSSLFYYPDVDPDSNFLIGDRHVYR